MDLTALSFDDLVVIADGLHLKLKNTKNTDNARKIAALLQAIDNHLAQAG